MIHVRGNFYCMSFNLEFYIFYLIVYFQSKTYDSVTDKFMDFSFEKVLKKLYHD